jgi:hypothetical protein
MGQKRYGSERQQRGATARLDEASSGEVRIVGVHGGSPVNATLKE